MPGSSLIIVKIRSITSLNSFDDRNDVSIVIPPCLVFGLTPPSRTLSLPSWRRR